MLFSACALIFLDRPYNLLYKNAIEHPIQINMFKKTIYPTIILPLICSSAALADKPTLKEHLTELKQSEYTEVQDAWKKCNAGIVSYLEVLEAEEKAIRKDLEWKEMSETEKKQLKKQLKKNLDLQEELKALRRANGF